MTTQRVDQLGLNQATSSAPASPSSDRVLAVLGRARLTYANEHELHQGVGEALTAAGVPFSREVALNARDRIDLLIGRVGIEVKVKGSWRDVQRQLARYADSDQISALVLVTSKPTHLRVATQLNGKPVHVHRVGSVL